jgi:hemoglobin-like flavoprotein
MGIRARVDKLFDTAFDQAWNTYVRSLADILIWIDGNIGEAERQAHMRAMVAGPFASFADEPDLVERCGGDVTLRPGDRALAEVVDASIPAELLKPWQVAAETLAEFTKVTR